MGDKSLPSQYHKDIMERKNRVKAYVKLLKLLYVSLEKDQRYFTGHSSCQLIKSLEAAKNNFGEKRDYVENSVQLLAAACSVLDKKTLELAHIGDSCRYLNDVMAVDIPNALDLVSKYEKMSDALKSASSSADLQAKKLDKRQQAEQTLEKLEESTRELRIKTLATLIDAEEKVELSIMEVSLQYLSEYRDFVNSGAQTFSSISTQIDELKAIWDSKSITLKERDTEKFIISQSKGKLFGLSIDEILEKEGGEVPQFLEKAFDFLRKIRAEEIEGIFRISGKKFEMDTWMKAANKSGVIVFDEFEETLSGAHNVTGLIKEWLRSLVVPLIPGAAFNGFSRLSNDDTAGNVSTMKDLLQKHVPDSHRKVLHYLIYQLNRIRKKSAENLMTANNLATVVGPNMVPPGDAEDPIAYLNHNKGVVQGISVLIENYDKIFSGRVPSNVIIRAPSRRFEAVTSFLAATELVNAHSVCCVLRQDKTEILRSESAQVTENNTATWTATIVAEFNPPKSTSDRLKLHVLDVREDDGKVTHYLLGKVSVPVPPVGTRAVPIKYPIKQKVPKDSVLVMKFEKSGAACTISVIEAYNLPLGAEYSYAVLLNITALDKAWETDSSPMANWSRTKTAWEVLTTSATLVFHILLVMNRCFGVLTDPGHVVFDEEADYPITPIEEKHADSLGSKLNLKNLPTDKKHLRPKTERNTSSRNPSFPLPSAPSSRNASSGTTGSRKSTGTTGKTKPLPTAPAGPGSVLAPAPPPKPRTSSASNFKDYDNTSLQSFEEKYKRIVCEMRAQEERNAKQLKEMQQKCFALECTKSERDESIKHLKQKLRVLQKREKKEGDESVSSDSSEEETRQLDIATETTETMTEIMTEAPNIIIPPRGSEPDQSSDINDIEDMKPEDDEMKIHKKNLKRNSLRSSKKTRRRSTERPEKDKEPKLYTIKEQPYKDKK